MYGVRRRSILVAVGCLFICEGTNTSSPTSTPTPVPTPPPSVTPSPSATYSPTSETWLLQFTLSSQVRGAVFPVNRWGTMCSLDDLEEDSCDCYGGAARRQGVIDRNRARAAAHGADHVLLDLGAFFFGSGIFYSTFYGSVSASFFTKAGYDAHTFAFRDLAVAASDGTKLGEWVDLVRSEDPTLPPAVVTNFNTTALYANTKLNASHVTSYTIATVESGLRVAVLGLIEPSGLTSFWQSFLVDYDRCVHTHSRRIGTEPFLCFHLSFSEPWLSRWNSCGAFLPARLQTRSF